MERKICNKCNIELPVTEFRLVRGQFYNPYYLGQCKKCEYKYQRQYLKDKGTIKFSDDLDMVINIQYREIKQERLLDLDMTEICPIAHDEIFVKLMDYKETYISNYGRVIQYSNNIYNLLQGSYDNYGALKYSVSKNVFTEGKWNYKRAILYAAKTVVEEFVVNPDKENNIFTWHKGYNKDDLYYKNLYPLNKEQYRIVKKNFRDTGNDNEDFICKVINEIKYKPDNWSKRAVTPIMCGIGYRGSENVVCTSESYLRWHDMINRCYNQKFHERQPQYMECTVCEEWKNYSNFKIWWDKYHQDNFDLDKDILFKGNKYYSPETCCFVPHAINTLFVNGKKGRGDCPVGVYFDNEKGKYRAVMSFMGASVKLGTFNNVEDAFARYKEYKEDFIKDLAEQYKGDIADKVYRAMMNWEIEITD